MTKVADGTETKFFHYPLEVKQVDVEARTFEGYASTWDRDLQDDVIERGAFKKTLSAWRKGERVIPLLDTHDRWSIRSALGKLDRAEERETGLWTKWQVVEGQDGDGALARVNAGIVDYMSIGYRATKWTIDENEKEVPWGIRVIHELDLVEVSLVLFPANPEARISAAKHMLEQFDEDERRKLWALVERKNAEPKLAEPNGKDDDRSAAALADQRRVDRLRQVRLSSLHRRSSIT